MTVIIGIFFVALAVTAFIYSLPRGGRVARFVDTEWEAYAVVTMISCLAAGVVLSLSGVVELAN